jgi:hypothetical protein
MAQDISAWKAWQEQRQQAGRRCSFSASLSKIMLFNKKINGCLSI